MIDLRSDTLTRPTPDMLHAMMSAEVGDDVFGEDPSVNALEEKLAALFGTEAALFCPTGTMSNQIAVKVHTQPGDEVICDELSHIYNYEGGGIGFHSGASVRLARGDRGRFSVSDLPGLLNDPGDPHQALTRLVAVENTCNRGGGSIWDFGEFIRIRSFCQENGLSFHLDGARLFNALVETPQTPADYRKVFDSISLCLSKGLGAPAGSVLTGTAVFVSKARRVRKVMGGGMRQAGYLAAAGIYALDHHVDRLRDDHRRARELETVLHGLPAVKQVLPVQSNIVVFDPAPDFPRQEMINRLAEKGLRVIPFGRDSIRMVTHLDFTDNMLEESIQILRSVCR